MEGLFLMLLSAYISFITSVASEMDPVNNLSVVLI